MMLGSNTLCLLLQFETWKNECKKQGQWIGTEAKERLAEISCTACLMEFSVRWNLGYSQLERWSTSLFEAFEEKDNEFKNDSFPPIFKLFFLSVR